MAHRACVFYSLSLSLRGLNQGVLSGTVSFSDAPMMAGLSFIASAARVVLPLSVLFSGCSGSPLPGPAGRAGA